jgi:hypothetical protein
MSENLRQFFYRSRYLMGAVFTRSTFPRAGNHNDHGAKPYSIVPAQAARGQEPPEMLALMERIHHRLDIIEQKIDQLLMPMDVITH